MALVFHLINALKLFVIADAVFSWVMAPTTFPRSFTKSLLDPVYDPVRRALPGLPIDISPLLALAVLYGVELALQRRERRHPR